MTLRALERKAKKGQRVLVTVCSKQLPIQQQFKATWTGKKLKYDNAGAESLVAYLSCVSKVDFKIVKDGVEWKRNEK